MSAGKKVSKTKLGCGRMRREVGLCTLNEPNDLSEALNLAHGVFLASNFSWNACEHCLFLNTFTMGILTDYILNLEE